MGTNYQNRELQKGWKSSVYCWRQKTKPTLPFTPAPMTLSAAATEGATSLTVTGGPTTIEKGNVLLFVDADELTYVAEVTSDSTGGTLTVKALAEAIPANATAMWPPELLDRTDAEITRSVDTQDTQTFNTGGTRLLTATVGSFSLNLPGPFLLKNGGYLTAFKAGQEKVPLWFMIKHEPPDAEVGEITEQPFIGKGYITEFTTSSAADGFRQGDLSVEITGDPISDIAVVGVA